jgi:hypothetical protein
MTTTTHSLDTSTKGSKLTAALEGFRARRAAKAERNRLELELSTYRTPAEISELDAMLERSGDDIDPVYTQIIERLRSRAA